MKSRNFVQFSDGHDEDIFYYKKTPDRMWIIFATESGIYICESAYANRIAEGPITFKCCYRMGDVGVYGRADIRLICQREPMDLDITEIYIDERVIYHYEVVGKDAYLSGYFTGNQDEDEESLKKRVLDNLQIDIEKSY